jgi:hypothetical protein
VEALACNFAEYRVGKPIVTELISALDVAAILDVTRQRVASLCVHTDFPEPISEVAVRDSSFGWDGGKRADGAHGMSRSMCPG